MADQSAPHVEHISSAQNPTVKLARQIAARRRARHREGLYLLEGERAIATAIQNGARIQTILIDEERRGAIPPALLASLSAATSRVLSLTTPLFQSISDAEQPQPLLAIATIPVREIQAPVTSVVALDAVRDPGNMGTIIRTSAAAGVDCIALLPGCVDPFNPKAVRASAGTVSGIPIRGVSGLHEVLNDWFADTDQTLVIIADSHGSTGFRDVDWKKPFVLVVGNEASGVSGESRMATTHTVHIPMSPGVESLNVSVATGVMLFEMWGRRQDS